MKPPRQSQAVSVRMYDIEPLLPKHISAPHFPGQIQHDSPISDTAVNKHELVQRLRNGDEAAFSSLMDCYHGRLLRFARTFVSNQAVAEEVVQETWMAVLKGIDRFEERSSLKTWIFQILKNRAKTKGKREHRYVPFSDMPSSTGQAEHAEMEPERFHTSGHLTGHWVIPPTTWEEITPERLLASKESLTQIENAIQALPPVQRQVIILRDIEDIASGEICEILHITRTNQRVLLHRARIKVRGVLNQYLQGFQP